MDKYTVFVIQAYESIDELGNMTDIVTLQIISEKYDDAMKVAKELVSKKGYRLSQVIQNFKPVYNLKT